MATQEAAIGSSSEAIASTETFETIVIGGGQAGLAVGYYLKKQGRPFVILDANERIGGSWRTRTWSSLRLFTPARYDGLPGWSFPAPGWSFPTALEAADYLEAYAARFDLPVRTGMAVTRLAKDGDRYSVECGERRFEADRVVVATGFYGKPSVPEFASELDPRIVQMHSSEYRDPSQLQPGGVLLVGAGNSGADIGMEVSKTHRTWLSGKRQGPDPAPDRASAQARCLAGALVRRLARPDHEDAARPQGPPARPRGRRTAHPGEVAGSRSQPASSASQRRRGVQDGLPMLEDGRVMDVANVIWCTGFRQDFSWIDVPVFGEDSEPVHERGVGVRAGPLLRRSRLPVLVHLGERRRRGEGRAAHRQAHRVVSRLSTRGGALRRRGCPRRISP